MKKDLTICGCTVATTKNEGIALFVVGIVIFTMAAMMMSNTFIATSFFIVGTLCITIGSLIMAEYSAKPTTKPKSKKPYAKH